MCLVELKNHFYFFFWYWCTKRRYHEIV